MKSYLFLLFMVLCSVYTNTLLAKPGSITGKVLDKNGKPLAYANIVVLQAEKATLVKADYTNDKGVYIIDDITNGEYIVKVSLVGYETYTSEKITLNDNNPAIPDVVLKDKSNTLKEVSVTAQKPFITVKPDMLVVNVENSIINAGSSALEVLSRSPGVRVDNNDNISLKGKPGVNIMINGKLQPISSADMASMLKGMPSSAIDKIELISNPSARYDAAGTAGIINIVLKKDQRMGMNGTVSGSFAQGVYPKATGSVNLNYRNKKLNAYATYNYAYRKGFNHLTLHRNFFDGNNINDFRYDQDHNSVFPVKNHLATAGIDYNVSGKTTIGGSVSAISTKYIASGNVYTIASNPAEDGALNYTAFTDNTANTSGASYSVNGNLRHKIDSLGKLLSVDVDYAIYPSKSLQDLETRTYGNAGEQIAIPYLLHGDITGRTQIRSLKADYVHPLKNNIQLEGGIKATYVTADNEPLFFDESSGTPINDTTKSNHYIYTENINAAYVNASKNIGKWGVQLGVRAEQSNIKGEQRITGQVNDTTYLQLFPSVSVNRDINDNNNLGITLSRRIERPNYHQLNPFRYYLDPTTYEAGNPYLKPALSYNMELTHMFKKQFVTTLGFSTTKNVITEVLLPAPGKLTIQTNVNVGEMRYYGVSCAYPFQFTKWWRNMTSANGYYSEYIGNLAGTILKNGKPTFDLNTNNTFTLPNNFTTELGFYYQAPMVYGFMTMREQWMLSAGVQKSFMNKRLTVRLNATDIFWHGYPRATSIYSGYTETFVAQRDTRQISISCSYRFGNNNVSPIRRHEGGAEDEKRRAGKRRSINKILFTNHPHICKIPQALTK